MAYISAPVPGTDRSRRACTFRAMKGGVRIPARTAHHAGLPVLGDVAEVKQLYPYSEAPLTKTARRKLAKIARQHGEVVRSMSTLALVR